jgi:CheY-like chemotaxis protein
MEAGSGQGSEFIVRISVLPASADSVAARPTPATAVSAEKCRKLVVDDIKDAAQLLFRVWQLMGHEIFTAHDGQQAVEAASRHCPDVILLDIGLPKGTDTKPAGISGVFLEATRLPRSHSRAGDRRKTSDSRSRPDLIITSPSRWRRRY